MSTQHSTYKELEPLLRNLLIVGVSSALVLVFLDYIYNFAKLWDFRVYLKARASYFETGNPYYDAESLRFIYPPSATFVFYLINDSAFFKSLVFILNGSLWVMTACFFNRAKYDVVITLPALIYLFGMQGWVVILTGNIGCLLYFSAALVCFLYYKQLISTVGFAGVVLLLTLIKPFYAEFLIFIWFMRGMREFLITSVIVIGAFFAINLFIYPELFEHFLDALKVDSYDTEIYGITAFSHFSSLGVSTILAAFFHFSLIGFLFALFLLRTPSLNVSQQFASLFILAVFINPKHISYDLMVCIPPLVVLLLQSRLHVLISGFVILLLASYLNFNPDGKPYFQWWYAFVATFILVLLDGRLHGNKFIRRIFTPALPTGVK